MERLNLNTYFQIRQALRASQALLVELSIHRSVFKLKYLIVRIITHIALVIDFVISLKFIVLVLIQHKLRVVVLVVFECNVREFLRGL
jgi:hypothetical protein